MTKLSNKNISAELALRTTHLLVKRLEPDPNDWSFSGSPDRKSWDHLFEHEDMGREWYTTVMVYHSPTTDLTIFIYVYMSFKGLSLALRSTKIRRSRHDFPTLTTPCRELRECFLPQWKPGFLGASSDDSARRINTRRQDISAPSGELVNALTHSVNAPSGGAVHALRVRRRCVKVGG